MAPHYDRHSDEADSSIAPDIFDDSDEEAIDDAAEALREVEVEAVRPSANAGMAADLESMSIDDLRKLAAKLDISERGQIVEKDKLIAAIRRRV